MCDAISPFLFRSEIRQSRYRTVMLHSPEAVSDRNQAAGGARPLNTGSKTDRWRGAGALTFLQGWLKIDSICGGGPERSVNDYIPIMRGGDP